jgi:hypothetical protein
LKKVSRRRPTFSNFPGTSGDGLAAYPFASFVFTNPQWTAIREAIEDGCAEPVRFQKECLEFTVELYLDIKAHYKTKKARVKAWERAARLAAEMSKAVACADPENYRYSEWLSNLLGHERVSIKNSYSIANLLAQYQQFASDRASVEARLPQARLKKLFYHDLLDLWLDAGGTLSFSRRDKGGPTVRYLRAVTVPVMGKAAPQIEGWRNIIEDAVANFVFKATELRRDTRGVGPPYDPIGDRILAGHVRRRSWL